MQGEFCTVVTAKKLSRENFVPNAGQSWGSPTGHQAPPAWRVPEGPVWRARAGFEAQSLAAVPVVGGGARPRRQWITGPGRSIHKQQEYPAQANFACNSPTTRIHARSKTAEYQRSEPNPDMRSREVHEKLLVDSHSWASGRCAEPHVSTLSSPAAHPAPPAPKQPAGPQATASATQQHVVSYNPMVAAWSVD